MPSSRFNGLSYKGQVKVALAAIIVQNQVKRALALDIEIGDTLLGGRFKNVPMVVEEIGTDELGQPTVNGRKLLAYRIQKKMPKTAGDSKGIPPMIVKHNPERITGTDFVAHMKHIREVQEREMDNRKRQEMNDRHPLRMEGQGPMPWKPVIHRRNPAFDPNPIPETASLAKPSYKVAEIDSPSCNDPEPPMQQLRRKFKAYVAQPKAARTP